MYDVHLLCTLYIEWVESRRRGQSVGLDRAAILSAAAELLAGAGSNGLSMRAVAVELGVTPNALYNHFRDKTDLIDALLDHTLGKVVVKTASDPRESAISIMVSTYDVLAAHGALVPLYLDRRGARGPNATDLGAHVLQALHSLGLDARAARAVLHVLIVQTIGFTAYGAAETDPAGNRAAFIRSLAWTLDGALG